MDEKPRMNHGCQETDQRKLKNAPCNFPQFYTTYEAKCKRSRDGNVCTLLRRLCKIEENCKERSSTSVGTL